MYMEACCKIWAYFSTREPQVLGIVAHKKKWLYTGIQQYLCKHAHAYNPRCRLCPGLYIHTYVHVYAGSSIQPVVSMESCKQHLWLPSGEIHLIFTAGRLCAKALTVQVWSILFKGLQDIKNAAAPLSCSRETLPAHIAISHHFDNNYIVQQSS